MKKKFILGCADFCPSKVVPIRASGACGVDVRFERVVHVKTGVRWMCSFMRSRADWTEERFNGRVVERSAIMCRDVSGGTLGTHVRWGRSLFTIRLGKRKNDVPTKQKTVPLVL